MLMVMQFSWWVIKAFVVDLGFKGIFMLVVRFAARRAPGGRIAQQIVCLASGARQSDAEALAATARYSSRHGRSTCGAALC
jgi:hypothetical protein